MIIFFVYGETFFVLGLAIALQSWKHSRLPLVRTLPWLAAFGFTHGFHEWGHLFISIQATYMPQSFINLLITLQALLLAISFALLFQFGIETLRPLPQRLRFVRYVPLALLITWGWYSGTQASRGENSMSGWYIYVSDMARYAIGTPGAIMAAYGLYRQHRELKQGIELPKNLSLSFTLAAMSLLIYALLGGIIVSRADFFPANWLNSQTLYATTWIPVELWRSLPGLILAVSVIRALELFRIELDRQLVDMEEQQVLLAERERIGRELHDVTLQSIYASGLLLRTVERDVEKAGLHPGLEQIHESIRLLDETIANIRHYIGNLQNQPTAHSLKVALVDLIDQSPIKSLVDVETVLDVPDNRHLTPVQIRHLLAITSEALSNVARHAHARRVRIVATAGETCLCLEITDDGQGMAPDYVIGYGLRNMQERARMLGGQLTLTSQPKRGTTIRVEIPWTEENEDHQAPDRG